MTHQILKVANLAKSYGKKKILSDVSFHVNEAEIVLFSQEGNQLAFTAKEDTKALLMTGQPLKEPIASYGPFVMNRSEEIQQAIADFRSGKMGSLKATFG